MSQPDRQSSIRSAQAAPTKRTAPTPAAIKKMAARATEASTKLENRSVPPGYVRTPGVKALLAARQARKH